MAELNIMQKGTCLAVGAASGLAMTQISAEPLKLGDQQVMWDTVVEAVAAVAGLGMQQFMPFTQPDIADGLASGGLTLLARRAAVLATRKSNTMRPSFGRTAPWMAPQLGGCRGQVGGVGSVSDRQYA